MDRGGSIVPTFSAAATRHFIPTGDQSQVFRTTKGRHPRNRARNRGPSSPTYQKTLLTYQATFLVMIAFCAILAHLGGPGRPNGVPGTAITGP